LMFNFLVLFIFWISILCWISCKDFSPILWVVSWFWSCFLWYAEDFQFGIITFINTYYYVWEIGILFRK
jgi:hypothetical protein